MIIPMIMFCEGSTILSRRPDKNSSTLFVGQLGSEKPGRVASSLSGSDFQQKFTKWKFRYFGLQYQDSKGYIAWLKLDKKVNICSTGEEVSSRIMTLKQWNEGDGATRSSKDVASPSSLSRQVLSRGAAYIDDHDSKTLYCRTWAKSLYRKSPNISSSFRSNQFIIMLSVALSLVLPVAALSLFYHIICILMQRLSFTMIFPKYMFAEESIMIIIMTGQVKQSILNMEIYCPPEASVLLASYAVQVRKWKF